MYSIDQIFRLNSDNVNISVNLERTKFVVNKIWKNASHHQKLQAIALGSYADVTSFDEVITTGRIDVLKAVVISHVFESDPYYLIGLSENDTGYDESVINDFIESYSGSVNGSVSNDKSVVINLISGNPIAKELLDYLSNDIINSTGISDYLTLNEVQDIAKKLELQAHSESMTAKTKLLFIRKILEY